MKPRKPMPGWFWILLVIAAACLLGTSPFWLLAIACRSPDSNC